MRNTTPLMLAAALLVATPVIAQETVDPALAVPADNDDDGFPWGLLGLLGLAGLIPRKRNTDTDNRTDRVSR
jgi:MYXO-CTERM domain-containing protein